MAGRPRNMRGTRQSTSRAAGKLVVIAVVCVAGGCSNDAKLTEAAQTVPVTHVSSTASATTPDTNATSSTSAPSSTSASTPSSIAPAAGGGPVVDPLVVSFRQISAPLLTMTGSAAELLQTCQNVAGQLDQNVPATGLSDVISAITDETLKEIVVDDVVVRQRILAACVQGNQADVSSAQSRAHTLDAAFIQQIGG